MEQGACDEQQPHHNQRKRRPPKRYVNMNSVAASADTPAAQSPEHAAQGTHIADGSLSDTHSDDSDNAQHDALEHITQTQSADDDDSQPPSKKHRPGRCSPVVVLPDGTRRVEMALKLSGYKLINLPKGFVRACFTHFPIYLQTQICLDGVLQAAKAACQIKQRASGPETAYECVFTKLSDYRCHRVTCLEVDSGCSQLTIHIHSGALHQQPAKAEQTTAASTGAAAAAADAGTTHWYEHKVSRRIVSHTSTAAFRGFLPSFLLRKTFGTSLVSPFDTEMTVYRDNQMLDKVPRRISCARGAWVCSLGLSIQRKLHNCELVKYRAAVPNMIEVYFSSNSSHGQASCQSPAAAAEISTNAAAAGGGGGNNGGIVHGSLAPPAAPVLPSAAVAAAFAASAAADGPAQTPAASPTDVQAAAAAMAPQCRGCAQSDTSDLQLRHPQAPQQAFAVVQRANNDHPRSCTLVPVTCNAALPVVVVEQPPGGPVLVAAAAQRPPAGASTAHAGIVSSRLVASTAGHLDAQQLHHATGMTAAAAEVKPLFPWLVHTAEIPAALKTPLSPPAATPAAAVTLPHNQEGDLPAAEGTSKKPATLGHQTAEVLQAPGIACCMLCNSGKQQLPAERSRNGDKPGLAADVSRAATTAAAISGATPSQMPGQHVHTAAAAGAGEVVVKREPPTAQEQQPDQQQQRSAVASVCIDLVDSDSDEDNIPGAERQTAAEPTRLAQQQRQRQQQQPQHPQPQGQQQKPASGVHGNSAGALQDTANNTAAAVGAAAAAPAAPADTGSAPTAVGALPPGFTLEPFINIAQAFKQLVLLLDQLSAPDDVMQRLQTAALAMLDTEESAGGFRRVQVVEMQYSIVQAWVKRGRGEQALSAVGILLDKAAGGCNKP